MCFLIGIPPYQKNQKPYWWSFTKGGGGTLEQTGNSTLPLGNGKGPEAKKEDCKDQPRKNGDFVQIRYSLPSTKNKTTKKRQKTRCSKSIVERSLGFFFGAAFFVHQFFVCISLYYYLSQFVYYIRLAQSFLIYDSKSTFNKPFKRSSRDPCQSFPHVMGIKE